MESSPQYFLDENADLNDMTEEIHNQRLHDALTRFWDVQAEEMVHTNTNQYQDKK